MTNIKSKIKYNKLKLMWKIFKFLSVILIFDILFLISCEAVIMKVVL